MSTAVEPRAPAPLVTLISDFGVSDFYVAAMKAVLYGAVPDIRLIDVTHEIARHDILAGAIVLERANASFAPGTFHLAVIDPGVGTDRRILVAQINDQTIVCPDNGLITWAWRRHKVQKCHELTWRPPVHSHVFHGRDVMAPVIARLCERLNIDHWMRPLVHPILLDIKPVDAGTGLGQIIHIDHFGNATTNLVVADTKDYRERQVSVGARAVGPIRDAYRQVPRGEALALVGSSGLLEIAVCEGSAAEVLGLKVGDPVELQR